MSPPNNGLGYSKAFTMSTVLGRLRPMSVRNSANCLTINDEKPQSVIHVTFIRLVFMT